MKMEEELLTYAIEKVAAKYSDKIKELFGIELVVPKLPFPVVTLKDLYDGLEKDYR